MSIWQILMAIHLSILFIGSIVLHGKPRTGKYDFLPTFMETLLLFVILYAGGFWD